MPAAAPGWETPGGETMCSSFQPPGGGCARICPEPGHLLRSLGKELVPLDRQSLKQSQREPGHWLFWLGTPGESQEGQLCPVFGPSVHHGLLIDPSAGQRPMDNAPEGPEVPGCHKQRWAGPGGSLGSLGRRGGEMN